MRRTPNALAALLALFALTAATAGCGPEGPNGERIGDAEEDSKQACEPAKTVLGIDISSYQHNAPIDWATVAKNRRFVIVKATEGTGYTNKYWADDVKQARAAGMIVGSYHWLHYTSTGAAQAQHFLSATGGIPDGDLPPMLDVEEPNDSATPAQRVAHMKEWLDTVEQATGRKPMIYSGSWYWDGYLGSPKGYGGVYPIAWANYNPGCPSIPDDFPGIDIWQYKGGTGTTPGISGACDQDKYYGDEGALLALANGGPDFEGKSLGKGGQSYPIVSDGPVTVEQGQTVKGWVKLKNVGKKTWKAGVVKLAPIPRDKPSAFHAASWENDHRISTLKADVAPGDVGEFELDIEGRDVGQSILSLGWVAEGITWFADAPKGGGPPDGYFAVEVKVTPAPPKPDAGAGGGAGGEGGAGGATTTTTTTTWQSAGGAGGSSAGSGGAAELVDYETPNSSTSSGCGCRAAGEAPTGGAPLAGLGALGLLALVARRRRRDASLT
jgi:MYXO-CTERM domain-containing protein